MKNAFLISCVGCACLCLGMSQNGKQGIEWQTPSTIKEFLAEEDHVKLSIKALSSEESEKYLKKDLLDIGYQPVEVTIENGSSDPYLFSPGSVDLPLVEGGKIAKRVLTAALPRSIGFKIASLFFWPLSIPGAVDSILTNKSYRKLKKQLQSKAVRSEVIAPYSSIHRVFFVLSEDYQNSFNVTLENQETLESKVFHIEGLLERELQTVEALPTVVENYYVNHEK
ncbi:MAG: hypothetical protein V4489_09575 [Chlamydiota bacterium]